MLRLGKIEHFFNIDKTIFQGDIIWGKIINKAWVTYEHTNKGKKSIENNTPPQQTFTATNIYQLHVAELTPQTPDIIIAVFINLRRSHY